MTDKVLQTLDSLKELMSHIKAGLGPYEFTFIVDEYKGTPYLQIYFVAPCNETGEMEDQFCRKWTLQYTMCDSEVVRTAHKAVEAAYNHERDENFTFMGEAIFSPHTDVYELVEMRKKDAYKDDVRIRA